MSSSLVCLSPLFCDKGWHMYSLIHGHGNEGGESGNYF